MTSAINSFLAGRQAAFNEHDARVQQQNKRRELQQVEFQNRINLHNAGLTQLEDGSFARQQTPETRAKDAEFQMNQQHIAELTKANNDLRSSVIMRETQQKVLGFVESGDFESLQHLVAKDRLIAPLFKKNGVHQLARIDLANDVDLLKREGLYDASKISDPAYAEEINKSFFKYFDGEDWDITNTSELLMATGLNGGGKQARLAKESIQRISNLRAAYQGSLRPPESAEGGSAKRSKSQQTLFEVNEYMKTKPEVDWGDPEQVEKYNGWVANLMIITGEDFSDVDLTKLSLNKQLVSVAKNAYKAFHSGGKFGSWHTFWRNVGRGLPGIEGDYETISALKDLHWFEMLSLKKLSGADVTDSDREGYVRSALSITEKHFSALIGFSNQLKGVKADLESLPVLRPEIKEALLGGNLIALDRMIESLDYALEVGEDAKKLKAQRSTGHPLFRKRVNKEKKLDEDFASTVELNQ